MKTQHLSLRPGSPVEVSNDGHAVTLTAHTGEALVTVTRKWLGGANVNVTPIGPAAFSGTMVRDGEEYTMRDTRPAMSVPGIRQQGTLYNS